MSQKSTNIVYVMISIIILLSKSNILPQVVTPWSKTFGGDFTDLLNSVQQTSDGGYIITGYTCSYGAGFSDVWLIKTNVDGEILWTKTFGGNDNDFGHSVQQTSDGGYIITGFTKSYGAGYYDVWLIRTNAGGDTLWTKTFGGRSEDDGYSVRQTSDSGYIITGYTESYGVGYYDVWLIKTNAVGDTLWTKTFGGRSGDYGYSVQQTSDSGYIITGYTISYGVGYEDVWLIKTDDVGDTLWTKTFGGNEEHNIGYSVQQVSDGGYIIIGYTSSYGTGYSPDILLIKTNSYGDTLWTKTFGRIGHSDVGMSVQQTSEVGYIITGHTESYGAGFFDVWLIKTNDSGDTLWTKTTGGNEKYNRGYSVQQTSDGGYIITGFTWSYGAGSWDAWLIKTDAEGNSLDFHPEK